MRLDGSANGRHCLSHLPVDRTQYDRYALRIARCKSIDPTHNITVCAEDHPQLLRRVLQLGSPFRVPVGFLRPSLTILEIVVDRFSKCRLQRLAPVFDELINELNYETKYAFRNANADVANPRLQMRLFLTACAMASDLVLVDVFFMMLVM